MNEPLDISRLLLLRKITRAIAELLGQELKAHLATLAPLLQPRNVFGQHLRGSEKQSVKGDAEAFEELRGLYLALARQGLWGLPKELGTPVDILQTPLDIAPADYAHAASSGPTSKTVQVSSPLRWVVAPAGFGLKRLRELVGSYRTSAGNEVQQCVLQFQVLHVTLAKRPGVTRLLEALRFPVTTQRIDEFGDLPITCVSAPIATLRPADEVIIQSTELSGTDVFEEVVSLDDLAQLRDPLRDRLVELVRSHDRSLLPE
jgi:hypothetical protein